MILLKLTIFAGNSKNKIKYWLDREEINPGKLWKTAIRDAINNEAYFLACFSQAMRRKLQHT